MEKKELLKYIKFLFELSFDTMNKKTTLIDRKYYEGKRNAYEDVLGLLNNDFETVDHVKNLYMYLNEEKYDEELSENVVKEVF